MTRPPDWRALSNRYVQGCATAPGSLGTARLMPAKIKSGRAAAVTRGISHVVSTAAIVTDSEDGYSALVTRWLCGGGSVRAVPIVDHSTAAAVCHNCAEFSRHHAGPVVYRCYDSNDELIYIGYTAHLPSRISSHRSNTYWWEDVADIRTTPYPTVVDARLAEARAIGAERPFYNVDGNPDAARDA